MECGAHEGFDGFGCIFLLLLFILAQTQFLSSCPTILNKKKNTPPPTHTFFVVVVFNQTVKVTSPHIEKKKSTFSRM